MATSGTITFRTNRNEVIKGALRLCSAYDPENSAGPSTAQITDAAESLNLLVKSWGAVGLQLWERRWGVVFPQNNQGTFILGSPGPAGDHACLTTPLNGGFVQTTLSTDAADGASTIEVESITGQLSTTGTTATTITNAYNIGIELDDGTLQWTTVNGAPSGTTVTLAAVLTDSATSGNAVYCYQTKLIRPLRVLDAFIRQTQGGNDLPCKIISRDEYNRFGVKSSPGTPTQIYYNPQSNTGQLYTYPVFNDMTQVLFIEFSKPIDDFTTSTDDYDLPQEWGNALKLNLALQIAPEYEVPTDKFKQIQFLAKDAFDLVNGYDVESPAGVQFQPANWVYESN